MVVACWLSSPARAEVPFGVDTSIPHWVVPQALPEYDSLPSERVDVQLLLVDRQVRVIDADETQYQRVVERIGSTEGVHSASEISLHFDPSVESLTLHHLLLIRDGELIDALHPEELRVVQQERELDQQIYNGEHTVLAFLRDVRVGDTIDYAWTTQGSNPALRGHFAGGMSLGYGIPVRRIHCRLLWPADRELHVKELYGAPEATVVQRGEMVEYTWRIDDAPKTVGDPDAPVWESQTPWVQLSEFATWGDVVDWALPLYEPAAPGPDLRAEIARWSGAGHSDSERVEAALRFVQDEVRYLGIEMGPRGLIPHAPDEVFARRFGDCKDKSTLLVTALRQMGFDAHPALVSTRRRHRIRDLHPTPFAFNHVIVRAEVVGQPLWLDATRSYRRGPVQSRLPPNLGAALVLARGVDELTEIGLPDMAEPEEELHEHYTLASMGGPAELTVTSRFRHGVAASMRREFDSEGLAQIQERYEDFYRRDLAGLESAAPLTFSDDPATGVFQTVERYRSPTLWDEGEFFLYAREIRSYLERPERMERTSPLAVTHPVYVVETLQLELPVDFEIVPESGTVDSEAFFYQVESDFDGRELTITHTYRSKADHVVAAGLEAHREDVERARELSVLWISVDMVDPGMPLRHKALVASVLIGFVLLAGHQVTRRGQLFLYSRALRQRARRGTGRTPEDPIQVASSPEALEMVQHTACECGGELVALRRDSRTIRGPQGSLLVLTMPCSRCQQRTTLHFSFLG